MSAHTPVIFKFWHVIATLITLLGIGAGIVWNNGRDSKQLEIAVEDIKEIKKEIGKVKDTVGEIKGAFDNHTKTGTAINSCPSCPSKITATTLNP